MPPLVLPEIPLFLLLNPGPSLTSYISSQCHLQAAFPYVSPFPCRGQLTLPLCYHVPWPCALRPTTQCLAAECPPPALASLCRTPPHAAGGQHGQRWPGPPIQGVSLRPRGRGGQRRALSGAWLQSHPFYHVPLACWCSLAPTSTCAPQVLALGLRPGERSWTAPHCTHHDVLQLRLCFDLTEKAVCTWSCTSALGRKSAPSR